MNAMAPPPRVKPGQSIQDRHKRAARMLGFALAADMPDTWQDFAAVMAKRLTVRERGAVTLMMATTLPDDEFELVLHKARGGAGAPPAPLASVMGEAHLWAAAATDNELRAYVFTGYHALSSKDRRDFLDHIGRGAL